jgi:thiamine kinase-like enzyme
MSDIVRESLRQIPGWQEASSTRLARGHNNLTWLIESAGQRAVLKIDARPRTSPFNRRAAEADIQRRAAEAGLAGSVLFASETIYLTEYLQGTVWSAGCLEDDANLDRLAAALKKMHALPLTGRVFDALGAARHYARRIDTDANLVEDCLQKIEAMPLPHNLCCCHNDLVAANIICTPDVRFLDWEYACDNDPFFDLATIVAHHRLAPERSDYLLDAYFDGDGLRWRGQLRRQAEFYEALLWLWEASRPGNAQ